MNDQPPIEAPQNRQTEDLRQQMAHFGITAQPKTVYQYQGYVYDRLADALAYARIDTARADKARGTPDVTITPGHAVSR